MFCLTYEFRLRPSRQQLSIFEDWLEINRKVYNYALAERKHWYKSRSSLANSCSLRSEYIIPADTPRPTFALQCKSLTVALIAVPRLKACSRTSIAANAEKTRECLYLNVGKQFWLSSV